MQRRRKHAQAAERMYWKASDSVFRGICHYAMVKTCYMDYGHPSHINPQWLDDKNPHGFDENSKCLSARGHCLG